MSLLNPSLLTAGTFNLALFAGGGGSAPTPPPFSPTDIAGLRVWLDASDASVINGGAPVDGDAIATITDKSTNAYSFAQATGGLRPAYRTNVKNGLSIMRGAASLLSCDIGADLTAFTLFFVVNYSTLRQFDCLLGSNTQTTGQITVEVGAIANANSGQMDIWGANQGSRAATGAASILTSTWYRLCFAYDAATPLGTFYIDNVSKNTTTQASMRIEGSNCNIFDDGAAGFTATRADIGEMILYNSVLNSTNRDAVDSFLRTKWGL